MTYEEYDPSQLDITFGITPIKDFIEHSDIIIERERPKYTSSFDSRGNETRNRHYRDAANITVTLTSGSSACNLLNNYARMDALDGTGVFPIKIKKFNIV